MTDATETSTPPKRTRKAKVPKVRKERQPRKPAEYVVQVASPLPGGWQDVSLDTPIAKIVFAMDYVRMNVQGPFRVIRIVTQGTVREVQTTKTVIE